MSQLFKILQHYTASEETFVRNVFHYFEEVSLYEYPKEIGFCDPNQIKIINELNKHFNLRITADGGYPKAEKAKVMIMPTSFDITPEIVRYELEYNLKFNKLEHKHIMGALYNLGINERLIGDIIVNEEGRVQIVISSEMQDTLPMLQTRYANIPVKYKLIDQITIESKAPKYAIRSSKTTRLDSICKAVTHNSRSLMSKEIKKGNVFLNHKQIKDPIKQVSVGDLLSIRGYGRAEIVDIIPVNGKFNIKYMTTNHKK